MEPWGGDCIYESLLWGQFGCSSHRRFADKVNGGCGPSLSKYFLIVNQEGTETDKWVAPILSKKKNQILGRILSKAITVAQAHREYRIAESCLYH